jgi:hypothetical protein
LARIDGNLGTLPSFSLRNLIASVANERQSRSELLGQSGSAGGAPAIAV